MTPALAVRALVKDSGQVHSKVSSEVIPEPP